MLVGMSVVVAAAAGFAVLVVVIVMLVAVMLMRVRLVARNGAVNMMLGVAACMVVRVIMGMIVAAARVMLVPVVIMIMFMMRMAGLQVGSPLGIEGGFDRARLAAKPFHHRYDDVIAANTEAVPRDLHGEVAVAEVPGQPEQMLGRFRADFAQRLGSADDLHKAAILQLHGIAGAQRDGLGQIEQERQSARAFHRDPATVPVLEVEHHRISGIALPVALGDHIGCTQHGIFLQDIRVRGCRAGVNRASTASAGKASAINPTTVAGLG